MTAEGTVGAPTCLAMEKENVFIYVIIFEYFWVSDGAEMLKQVFRVHFDFLCRQSSLPKALK
jgi:hypothetical protein